MNNREIKVGEEYEVVVQKQDHFGDGITKVKDMFVFVKNGLPGDKLRIEITNVKKTFAMAKILEIVKPSDERVDPYCRYFDVCGGCQIMDQDYPAQLKFKEQKVRELFKKFAEIPNLEIETVSHGKEFHYRNKIIFHGLKRMLGFYKEKSNSLVAVKLCLLAEQELNIIYNRIIEYLNNTPEVTITDLLIRKTSTEEYMIVAEGKFPNKQEFLEFLKEVPIHSVYLNNQLVYGKKYITEKVFDLEFRIYPEAFFQVNYDMMKVLYQIVLNYYKQKNYNKVLDLYCGTGTIGMLLSSYVKEVVGIELVHDAIKAANQNKEINNISNIRFIEGKVEDKIQDFKDIDSIVVDPPRSGLDSVTLQSILEISPRSIVYVSCDPVTLARDLKVLLEHYTLEKVNLVDMFPNTYHIETVVILEKNAKRTFKNYGILINKKHPYLEEDFQGMILTKTKNVFGDNVFVEKIAYEHYLQFRNDLEEKGIIVGIGSGYRTYEEQEEIWEKELSISSKTEVERWIAPPGFSEFHTGLAIEILVESTVFEDSKNYSEAYRIIEEMAPLYGYVLRYPENKESYTGFVSNNRHYRYVGSGISRILFEKHITLEEYHDEKEEKKKHE